MRSHSSSYGHSVHIADTNKLVVAGSQRAIAVAHNAFVQGLTWKAVVRDVPKQYRMDGRVYFKALAGDEQWASTVDAEVACEARLLRCKAIAGK